MNTITKKTNRGSISAIIHTLNERMADLEVRIRAIFANGILQVLCEAEQADQLEQSIIVPRVREILESISPPNIHRVRINSRLIQKQQLLWLETISEDPQNYLLWAENIVLRKPNWLKQWNNKSDPQTLAVNSTYPPQLREQSQFQKGLIGGVFISLLMGVGAFSLYNWSQSQFFNALNTNPEPILESPSPDVPLSSEEKFREGVKLAEEAAAEGKVADTRQEWLEIANKWQKASDLMAGVSEDFERYETAQDRAYVYRENSEKSSN
jgi:hypothetical protein